MNSKKEHEKIILECHQIILSRMLKDDDNKYCIDCDGKGPRWASWNLGIFLCIRCAGIHRNLGVHISKVKSVNLDSWTAEQIAMMQEIGNSRGRAVYEANIPDNFRRPQTDAALEQFIRAKYEHKRYMAHEWVPPKPDPSAIIEEVCKLDKRLNRPSMGLATTPVKRSITAPPGGLKAPTSALPRPVASVNSGSSPRLAPADTTPPRSTSVDLLGLDSSPPVPAQTNPPPENRSSQDLFGDFLLSSEQAPSSSVDLFATEQTTNPPPSTTSTEDTWGAPSEPVKSTKESILALYGSIPSGPQQVQHSQMNYFGGSSMPAGPAGYNMQSQQLGTLNNGYGYPSGVGQTKPYGGQMYPQNVGQQPNPAVQNTPNFAGFPQQHAAVQSQQQQQMYLQQIQQKLSGLQMNGSGSNPSPSQQGNNLSWGDYPSGTTTGSDPITNHLWQ